MTDSNLQQKIDLLRSQIEKQRLSGNNVTAEMLENDVKELERRQKEEEKEAAKGWVLQINYQNKRERITGIDIQRLDHFTQTYTSTIVQNE